MREPKKSSIPATSSEIGSTDYRAALDRLIAIWDSHTAESTVNIAGGVHPAVPSTIRALTAHAVDCARGILVLYRAKLPLPAAPLVRTLLEDSITAGWILTVPEAWRALASDGADQRRKALNETLKFEPENPKTLQRIVELRDLHGELGTARGWKFEQRVNALEGTQHTYLMYRFTSGLSHAGADIVDAYTAVDDSSPLGVSFRPHAAHPTAAMLLGVAASSLLSALVAWDCCLFERRDQAALDAIGLELGVRSDWALAPRT